MRKRLMNISKRCMVAIMSAAFIMSSVTVSMAFPVGVYAEEVNTQDEVSIDHNIDKNTGDRVTICEDVTVGENVVGHHVENNYGTINTNNGNVTKNFEGGVIVSNTGRVFNNMGTITNSDTGNVIGNWDEGTVLGNGSVVSNYGGTVGENVEVTNQYYRIKAEGFDNAAVEIESFSNAPNTLYETRNYILKEEGIGTVTVTPADDYEILGDEETEAIVKENFRYTIAKDENGVFTATISDVTGNVTLTPQLLGLIIQKIQQQENAPISQVVVNTSDNTDDSSNDGDQSDSTGNVSASENATDRILKGMNSNSKQNVFELDYTKQSNLTWKDIEQLCSTRNNVPKNCYFNVDGKQYILQIPAIDPYTAEFKACLTELQSEENGMAGPLTIAKIFKDQGVTCTEIKPQIASATGIAATAAVAPASDFGAFSAQQNAQINAMLQQISSLQASGRLDLLQAFTKSGFVLNISNYSTFDAQTCDLLGQVLDAGVPVKIDYTYGGVYYRTTIPANEKSSLSSLASDGGVTIEELMGAFETKTM